MSEENKDILNKNEKKEKKGFFARLKEGLAKTRNNIVESFADVFGASHIDDDFYENLEETFIMADMGIRQIVQGSKAEAAVTKFPSAKKARYAKYSFVFNTRIIWLRPPTPSL